MDAALLQRIDFLKLAMHLGGKKPLIAEMLALFFKTASDLLMQMEIAARDQNVLLWLQTAHKLKGAAQNVTAKRLVGLCLEAEAITTLPHAQGEAVLYHLHKELALLRDAVTREIAG